VVLVVVAVAVSVVAVTITKTIMVLLIIQSGKHNNYKYSASQKCLLPVKIMHVKIKYHQIGKQDGYKLTANSKTEKEDNVFAIQCINHNNYK
jgi:hypothetical protein